MRSPVCADFRFGTSFSRYHYVLNTKELELVMPWSSGTVSYAFQDEFKRELIKDGPLYTSYFIYEDGLPSNSRRTVQVVVPSREVTFFSMLSNITCFGRQDLICRTLLGSSRRLEEPCQRVTNSWSGLLIVLFCFVLFSLSFLGSQSDMRGIGQNRLTTTSGDHCRRVHPSSLLVPSSTARSS